MPILRIIKSKFQRKKVTPKTILNVITVLVVSDDWENIAVKYIIAIVVIRKKTIQIIFIKGTYSKIYVMLKIKIITNKTIATKTFAINIFTVFDSKLYTKIIPLVFVSDKNELYIYCDIQERTIDI